MNEKFILCDLKTITTKKGDVMYYLVVYSSLELLERVYVTQEIFEMFKKNKTNSNFDINNILYRGYNTFTKKFVIMVRK